MPRRIVELLWIGAFVALAAAPPRAIADASDRPPHDQAGRHDGGGRARDGGGPDRNRGARWVPEFDTAAVGVVAALLAGGGVLLARRRGKD